MFSLGEYEGIVVRWSLVVQYMSVSSIIYSVLLGEYEGIVVRWSLVVQCMSVSSIIYSVLPRRV